MSGRSTAGTHRSRFPASRSLAAGMDEPARIHRDDRAGDRPSSGTPSSASSIRSSRAIPVPAAPAPTSTIRASAAGRSSDRSAEMTPVTTIAAVPWMSSLNDGTRSR